MIGLLAGGARALQHRVREALAVPLRRQVARELRDEQPPVGEDEDAEVPCCLDEAGRGDRLAGGRRVAEAVAAAGAGIGAVEAVAERLVDEAGVEVVLGLLVELRLLDGAVAAPVGAAVAVLLGVALGRGDELGEHPGERVDLMPAQLGPGGGPRRVLRQDALEPEHEPVPDLPPRRGAGEPCVHLLQGVVERGAAGRTRGERDRRVLVGRQERLAEPGFGTACRRGQVLGCVRRQRRRSRHVVYLRSTSFRAAPP